MAAFAICPRCGSSRVIINYIYATVTPTSTGDTTCGHIRKPLMSTWSSPIAGAGVEWLCLDCGYRFMDQEVNK